MNHVLPPQWNQTFKVLYDEAPTVPYDEIKPLFIQDFGKEPNELFKEFDTEPIASASIAQVHKATLHSGETVAVKVQKPYIANQMKWDLLTYRLVTYLFEKLFDLPIYWSVDTIEDHLKTEVNFLNEAANAERAHKNLREDTAMKNVIYVPKVYHGSSSKRILTCEWIDGVKFGNKEKLEETGFSVSKVVEDIVTVFADVGVYIVFLHV